MEFHLSKNGFVSKFDYGMLEISSDEKHGFRPYQLFVSSIAICSGEVFKKVLEKKRIQFEDIRILAKVTRNPGGIQEIKSIHLHFIIQGKGISELKIKKALEVTYRNCSMVQSVKDSIVITESFEIAYEKNKRNP